MRRLGTWVVAAAAAASAASVRAASDPYCTGDYARALSVRAAPLRFGIDPGLAGNVGGAQLPAAPDDVEKDIAAVRALRPSARVLVVRLNRLFWSGGEPLIRQFRALAARYARTGQEVELQVRYHPASGHDGDLRAWRAYVRHVVDVFGAERAVVAMTITNEVNVTFSPNTSDGAYTRASDALIEGIEAAHAESLRRGNRRLRFGFTYAYRFSPPEDAAFFSYLRRHGGRAFRRALGFVGIDFYPGSVYPPVIAPGDSLAAETAQALGTLRRCLLRKASISATTPIWVTENGYPTGGSISEARQAQALREIVGAVHRLSRTLGVTDYRWFNLRDSGSSPVSALAGPAALFTTDGLVRADYTRKPSFAALRAAIAAFGRR